ncbi:MAG: 4Fe-4S binding domain protein [Candidatus Cloacimonetes bacterium ADurb.Bin088]|jgi:uncharacterized protein (DUF362 family)/Pyruvate/2-oxoacid:ferredoxin oxidoreductase delta subunit|nr:MAG: 4Fe-4S binding domain protein [Candidatus Cloacimonetes bacterium ADurb.Bin088]
MPQVQIRKIESYDPAALDAAVKSFLREMPLSRVNRSKRVLIKPNLLGAYLPERAVTTHPAVVEALVRYWLEKGKEVWIGDSPGGALNVERVWETCGYNDLAKRYPVKLVNLSTSGFRELDYEGTKVKISEVFWRCGIIINVAKYKTHSLTGFTGGLKNLYGLVPGLIKTDYHRLYPATKDFAALLLALYRLTRSRVSYSFIDGILGMDGAGPSAGRVRNFGLLFGSRSIPAMDYTAARLMGFRMGDVPYLREALHGDGILPSRIKVPTSFQDFTLPDVDIRVVKLRKELLKYVPRIGRKIFQKVYYFHPRISERCKSCGLCVRSCPVHAITPPAPGILPAVNPKVCIKCMCCHEMCPHHAVDIHKSFLAGLVTR